ncbi:MAG: radical SAM protein, partial [Nitrospinota bacterium]
MNPALKVNEVFFSIQGETTRTGIPTVFIRLAECNLRCRYCDTAYAYEKGDEIELEEIIRRADSFKCKTAEITGGEPMIQKNTPELARKLMDSGYTVMIETNGTVNLSPLPQGVIKIVDIKCPDSGSGGTFLYENLKC